MAQAVTIYGPPSVTISGCCIVHLFIENLLLESESRIAEFKQREYIQATFMARFLWNRTSWVKRYSFYLKPTMKNEAYWLYYKYKLENHYR